ncbi:MAG: hypothetical protein ABWY04_05360, partial [Arthrobacter sp.]
VDLEKIVQVADESRRTVGPHADAISAFIIGYAAGTASTEGRKGTGDAVRAASDKVLELCEEGESGGPDEKGWAKRAQ